ncbi:hypothetical protein [Fulvimonas yonginensis]|uniref:Uncharacterized protein n=1 Tax=Fulvimonas yonginensis TaxID=1495200 RepID=A0ABU8JDX9_9GAMM
MRLSRIEKQVIVAAGVVACLIGALAGYGALSRALEDQFHGGVLDEDRVGVLWRNAWDTLAAFIEAATVAWSALGFLPVGLSRLLFRRGG